MGSKKKGTRAERELIHLFFNTNTWIAIRVAGSGSMPIPCPDIVVGNGKRVLAIECKSLADNIKYFKEQELADLIEFSRRFGAEAWLGVRFDHVGWFFIQPNNLILSKKGTPSISLNEAKEIGLKFEQLTNM
ncbi:Holliday junction resolvase [Candidatus Woesearchaeota archaeon]|nr:Holliday junction resolvase [Candidatus Woesearchaeota archaeon]